MADQETVQVRAWVLDSIGVRALASPDAEVCGLLGAYIVTTGEEYARLITDFEPVLNVADQPDRRYQADEDAFLAAWKGIEDVGPAPVVRVVGWYHSHVLSGHTADLSDTDVEMAVDPAMLHFVYATRRDEWLAWRVLRAGDRSSVVSVEIKVISRPRTRHYGSRKES